MALAPSRELRSSAPMNSTSFPTRQLFILALCRICEPIAFMSIFPYVYYMVESFHVTNNAKQIAMYAGMVTSAYAFAEFLTGPLWGRLSDRIGRKPVLLCGLAGTGISMLGFGFAPNLTTALVARAVGGLLNGSVKRRAGSTGDKLTKSSNIGVLQTTVAEVVKVEAHQARAYSIMPSVWCLGAIIGSGLGGALADPVRNYPTYFDRGTIFETYPYLLPNLVCASVVVFSVTTGILFLEETHEDQKNRKDLGLEFGRWILGRFRSGKVHEKSGLEESFSLLTEDQMPPDYASRESSPVLAPTTISMGELPAQGQIIAQPSLPRNSPAVTKAFTYQVMLNIISYGILAYHTISAEQLLPVLFSLPESDDPPHLPFQFTGGFALSTKAIGFILSIQGFIQMFATLIVFPFINRRLGNLATSRLAILTYPILYLLTPYLTLVPESWRNPSIYALLVWKVTAQALSYPSLAIMLANAAPSKKVLGTLNGVQASAASLARAFGPTLSGLLQSAGLSFGCLGLPWWASAGAAVVGAVLSMCMVEKKPRQFFKELQETEGLQSHECADAHDLEAAEASTTQGGHGKNADVEPLQLSDWAASTGQVNELDIGKRSRTDSRVR